MKTVIMSFTGEGPNYEALFPFTETVYKPVYAAFVEQLTKHSIDVRISFHSLYRGHSTFAGSFTYAHGAFVQRDEPVTADIILCRGTGILPLLTGDEFMINPPSIYADEDKLSTAKRFPDMVLRTQMVDPLRWEEQLNSFTGDMIVCKPRNDWGGKGIIICKKEDFSLPVGVTDDSHIFQQYIDSSGGVPGIVEGVHDLRIILSGQQPIAYIRLPRAGSLLANLSQGGSAIYVPYEQIPGSALKLALRVEQELTPTAPHFYSADFIFDQSGKPYLCEINSQPGFSYPESGGEELAAVFRETLISVVNRALAL